MKNPILVSTALMALALTTAQAATFTETVTVLPTVQGTTGQLAFNIPQFNPGLGTLLSVELTLTPTIGDFGYSVINFGPAATVLDASVGRPLGSLTDAAGFGLDATWSNSQTLHCSGSFPIAAGSFSSPAYASGSLPFTSFTLTPSSVAVGPDGFVGSGLETLLINGAATANVGGSPGGSLFYSFYGNVGGDLQVTFDYVPVPEPSSPALLVLGGCLFARRLRRQSGL